MQPMNEEASPRSANTDFSTTVLNNFEALGLGGSG